MPGSIARTGWYLRAQAGICASTWGCENTSDPKSVISGRSCVYASAKRTALAYRARFDGLPPAGLRLTWPHATSSVIGIMLPCGGGPVTSRTEVFPTLLSGT